MTQTWRIDEDAAHTRLDQALAQRLGLSRRELTRLLDRGIVQLNGKAVDRTSA